MNRYIATFHTHLAALLSSRVLPGARMAPVPRKLSSSCGTCVFYEADDPCFDRLDRDTEAVYALTGPDTYRCLREFD